MKEKILAALKTRFEALKIKEEILARFAEKLAVTTKETDDVEQVVSDVTFDRIFQSEFDSRVTDANKKAVENAKGKIISEYEKEHGLKEGKPEKKDEPGSGGEKPEWFAAWEAEQKKVVDELKTKVEGYEQKATKEQLRTQVLEKLKDIPKSYLDSVPIDVTDPEQIEQVAEKVKTGFNALKQEMVNANLVFDKPRDSSNGLEKADIDGYLDEKFGKPEKSE